MIYSSQRSTGNSSKVRPNLFNCAVSRSDRHQHVTNNVDLKPMQPLVSGYTNVYQTNISGIGVRYTFNSRRICNSNCDLSVVLPVRNLIKI